MNFNREMIERQSSELLDRCPIAPIRVPIMEWLPNYSKENFVKDLIAGFTVFIFLIPQGMAYAILAGMPPVYGLYSAVIPLYVFAIFSTSRHLSMGPMAITSLLLGTTCQKFGFPDQSPEYINVAIGISLLSGFISIMMGLFRLGSLAGVISNSVLTGFLTASALVIALSQLKYIFGIPIPRFTYTHETIIYLLSHLPHTNYRAVLLGFGSIGFLVFLREWKKRNKTPPIPPPIAAASSPSTSNMASTAANSQYYVKLFVFRLLSLLCNISNLLVIFIGALISHSIHQSGGSIQIVGTVPSGMKAPSIPSITPTQFLTLLPSAIALSFVAFANNWAIASKYAANFHYQVEATQELVASGLATLVGTFFNCFLVAGGLARTSVSVESGATSQMVALLTATFIAIALFAFTSFFYYIPMTVLASVIEVSVIGMVDFQAMIDAYRVDRRDCLVMVLTFLATFFIGVLDGLFVGIFVSFAMVMRTVAFPQIVHLGKLPDEYYNNTNSEGGLNNNMIPHHLHHLQYYYKDIARFPEAQQIPGIAIIRMDASLFFGNCQHFKVVVKEAAAGKYHSHPEVAIHKVIIDASAWIDIDLAGIKTLFEVKDELWKGKKVVMVIACAKGVIRDCVRQYSQDQASPPKGGGAGGGGSGGLTGGGGSLATSCLLSMSIEDAIQGKAAMKSRIFSHHDDEEEEDEAVAEEGQQGNGLLDDDEDGVAGDVDKEQHVDDKEEDVDIERNIKQRRIKKTNSHNNKNTMKKKSQGGYLAVETMDNLQETKGNDYHCGESRERNEEKYGKESGSSCRNPLQSLPSDDAIYL